MEEQTYEKAYAELKEIMSYLDGSDIDIDQLSQKVRRAQELIAFCQQKLTRVEEDVSQFIKNESAE
ncbi:MAG: exodeoxyribonuclease VII small subunit [Bacteroidales bacterium]|nr:exodeoxyribonuclease VII small subunit [Bacteroidales bacterium]